MHLPVFNKKTRGSLTDSKLSLTHNKRQHACDHAHCRAQRPRRTHVTTHMHECMYARTRARTRARTHTHTHTTRTQTRKFSKIQCDTRCLAGKGHTPEAPILLGPRPRTVSSLSLAHALGILDALGLVSARHGAPAKVLCLFLLLIKNLDLGQRLDALEAIYVPVLNLL